MILEMAVADALGAPYEFKTAADRAKFTQKGFATPDGVGRYTDDTQMSVAVCEHMLAGSPNTQEAWAEHFIDAYRRDPRNGYAKRVITALQKPSPRRMLEAVGLSSHGSRGNGTVMRCVPLGMLKDPGEVAAHAAVQSSATHSSPKCAMAAVYVALASHYIYHRWESAPKLFAFLKEQMGAGVVNDITLAWKEGTEVPCEAYQTASYCVRLAATALQHGWAPEHCIDHAVRDGGDVDSTAAVSVALVTMRPNLPGGEQVALVKALENGPYGRDHLIRLDMRMASSFPRLAGG